MSQQDLDPDVLEAVEAARSKQAEDIRVLDLRGVASFTDTFVVSTGNSTRQVQAIADQVVERLKLRQRRPLHVEGQQRGEWVLIDYADFVVHVFLPATRAHYGLERLWHDARPVPLAGEA